MTAMSGSKARNRRLPERVHTYPSEYPPGKHWSITQAWEVLDFLTPGVLTDEARALLAGMIAGKLMKERERAALIALRGRAPHVAEAIRRES